MSTYLNATPAEIVHSFTRLVNISEVAFAKKLAEIPINLNLNYTLKDIALEIERFAKNTEGGVSIEANLENDISIGCLDETEADEIIKKRFFEALSQFKN